MKKILSFFLAAMLLLSLLGCNAAPEQKPTDGFVPPVDYVAVMVVTINPQFRLYLDANGVVLAAEPMNEDAKAMEKELEVVNKPVETAMKNLVTEAKEQGYVKENATVSLTLTETTVENVNTEALLNNASVAVQEISAVLEVTVDVQTEDVSTPEQPTDAPTEAPTEQPTEAPTEEPTEAPTEYPHDYADATCTTPKTCKTCGATDGKAKGHNYKNATCTAAKTCKTCGKTDGKALGHDYKEGVCSRCKAKDPDFSYTPVADMPGDWCGQFAVEEVFFSADMFLGKGDTSCSAGISMQVSEIPDDAQEGEYFEFDGKIFHAVAAGDGDDLGEVTEKDNIITVFDCEGQKLVLERTGEKTLKVISCEDGFAIFGKIPTGIVFTYLG